MKITCKDVHSFVQNIENDEDLFRRIVYVEKDEQQLESSPVLFDIYLTMTGIVSCDDADFLVQCSCCCGRDCRDSTKGSAGTDAYNEVLCQLREICAKRQWKIMSGRIGE